MRALLALGPLLVLSGCDRSPPERTEAPGASPAAARSGPAEGRATPGPGISWSEPAGWRKATSPSPMRRATWTVPRAAGDPEDAEVAVFFFGGGQGGSVEANVARWIGQFSGVKPGDAKRADREANGIAQHVVEIERGTFQSGMPGAPPTPKKDFAMVAAIVKAPDGNYFFKLTGPAKTVSEARSKFFALLDTVKAE